MATAIEMPKLGNTVEECLVSRWVRRKGDHVEAGEVVAEIETDKTTFEVNAPIAGTVLEIFFDEGALVPVFTNILVIGEPGEDVGPFAPGAKAAPEPAPPVEEARRWSPRARKFAEERGFHPDSITGSGPGGRVLEEDVRRAFEAAAPKKSAVRDKIARRMRESLASTAQYTLHASADAGGLLILRARMKASGTEISINDMVAFCTVKALLERREVNGGGREVHLGFACDTERGLLVPVVRDAQGLGLDELARRMKALAAAATAGRIAPDDLTGATFTISNLGGLGIESFTPILNPPQAAILGVGAIGLKAVRRAGRIEFVDAIGLSLTCDHQVIDGAPGARFLQVVKEKIEKVESLLNA